MQIYFYVLCICHVFVMFTQSIKVIVTNQFYHVSGLFLLYVSFNLIRWITSFRMCCYAEVCWNKKKLGFNTIICKRKTIKITKSSMYNTIKIYNLQENGCSASVIFGKVSTALSFSLHWGSLNCFSFLKTKFYLWYGLLKWAIATGKSNVFETSTNIR